MNNKKHDEDFFRMVYGDEELEKIKKSGKVNIPSEYSIKPPKKLKFEVDKINNEKSTLNERMQLENSMIKFETKKIKNMETFEDLFKEFQSEKDMTNQFTEIANNLMNYFVIRANRKDYRLAEIEFYLYEKDKHKDDFIHAKIIKDKPNDSAKHQIKMGCWYFHYSGIDLTFGNGKNRFGGILIRSLVALDVKSKPIIGPLKLKNHLLNQYEFLNQSRDFLKLVYDEKILKETIIPMQRIGLGTTGNGMYKNHKYRFVVSQIQNLVKKE